MSVGYQAVSWNPAKRRYDLALVLGIVTYLAAFAATGAIAHPTATVETLLIRGLGTCAFVMLHVVLSIGPLSRLSPAFLPLLYNRRHFGVATFLIALAHGAFSTVQFHGSGNVGALVSLLGGDPGFQTFGVAALVVLFLMAATSHDFWLAHLTAPAWKALHMSVYAAYALLCVHVGWGALRSEAEPVLAVITTAGFVWLVTVHLLAAARERVRDAEQPALPPDGWIDAGPVAAIPDTRARVLCASGERIAVFRHSGKISAISNVCQHQNGPLGEGKILDGCVTCPWHGYQYRPENGRAPAPFTEMVPTFRVRVVAGHVWIDPHPLPPGTHVPPAEIQATAEAGADAPFYVGYLDAAPDVRRRVRRWGLGLVAGSAGVAAALAVASGPFGPGLFEYTAVGSFEGTIAASPYPVLIVEGGAENALPRRLPLVAPGKHGADSLVARFDGQPVVLRGKRVVLGDDVMIEIEPGSIVLAPGVTHAAGSSREFGIVTLSGEIVDSKCFFGVMNPGRLEVHRACAIRCIAGGIPPILYVRDLEGGEGWVFLVSADGRPVNGQVLDLVARPVTIDGRLEMRDGRFYLHADPASYRAAAAVRARSPLSLAQ